MTTLEKIADRKSKIAAAQVKIEKEQAKIAKWKKEISSLESLEVKAMLKEIDLPLEKVRELLETMKPTPVVDPATFIEDGTGKKQEP